VSPPPVPILFTIPNFITAGSGQAMINIIERLDRSRFAPAVCVSRSGGRLESVLEGLAVPLIVAPFTVPPRPYASLAWRARRAAAVFRPHGFALWHSFHYSDDYTEPLIARAAGARAWVFTKKNMGWGSRAWLLRSLLASRIAVQNTDMQARFFDRWPLRDRARFVPRGVDVVRFDSSPAHYSALRHALGIPLNAVVVGCVAHLVPVKGHPTLLNAAARVPGVVVLLAGKPLDRAYSDALKQQAEELGISDRVHFLGGVDDVAGFLAEIDVAVLPTWARWRMEGCPVALLEALAAGKACVATDIPGSRDIVENGVSGILVPPEDPEALALALQQLASSQDLRQQLGAAARQRIMDSYRIEREVADHVALYDEVLQRR
jgi:glycosyltransferase involved in cell wall biosynthesis